MEAQMREDMYKVVINRPRHASRYATKAKLRYLGDHDVPSRMTGKQIFRYKKKAITKHFSDHVMPLKRYLFSQRGRKWDDVFSEICAQLDTGSTVKMHVHEHIDGFILRKVRIDEDGVYRGCGSWHYNLDTPDRWWPDLYVCPIDGRVKETKVLLVKLGLVSAREKRRLNSKKTSTLKDSFRRLNETEFLVLCDGIWYRFETSAPPRSPYGYPVSDHSIRNELRNYRTIEHPQWTLISKKQLSSKVLKKHGLRNGGCDV
jgi:hypothetical protein